MPTTETFTPQEKNVETRENAFAGDEGSVKWSDVNLPPRDPKDERVALQSLLILFLIDMSLSATIHIDIDSNFKSVIQKPQTSFVQVSPKRVWHKDDPSDTPAKIDYRTEFDERFDRYRAEEPTGIKVPESHDVLKKTIYLQSPDRPLKQAASTTWLTTRK